ncbi:MULTISPECIES: hypothetical protein [Paracoccus]|mgnify:FL=1|uniref:hypothetical protein n=1 Tax=Paracoccus TaxID=265 RepID=UPI0023F3A188|nr:MULTISPECIES: hypothetical protein [Paracoccus]
MTDLMLTPGPRTDGNPKDPYATDEWNAALDKAAQIARGNGAYATAHAILAHKRKVAP